MFSEKINTQRVFTIFINVIFVLFLAACASQDGTKTSPVSAVSVAVAETTPEAPQPVSSSTVASSSNSGSTKDVSFAKDILPILQNSCVSCHGGDKTSAGLDMKAYASVMAGSQKGQVIVPGDASNSLLIKLVQSGKMPKRKAPLTQDQLKLLIDWVNSGAKNN